MNAWKFQSQLACGGCHSLLVPEPYDPGMTWLCSCMNHDCDRRGVKLMVPMEPVELVECLTLDGITAEMVEAEAAKVRCCLCGEELERVGVSKWQHYEPCSSTGSIEDFLGDAAGARAKMGRA